VEYPHSCKDQFGRLRVAAGVGVTSDTLERTEALVKAGVDALVVDTAHGHSQGVLDTLKSNTKQNTRILKSSAETLPQVLLPKPS